MFLSNCSLSEVFSNFKGYHNKFKNNFPRNINPYPKKYVRTPQNVKTGLFGEQFRKYQNWRTISKFRHPGYCVQRSSAKKIDAVQLHWLTIWATEWLIRNISIYIFPDDIYLPANRSNRWYFRFCESCRLESCVGVVVGVDLEGVLWSPRVIWRSSEEKYIYGIIMVCLRILMILSKFYKLQYSDCYQITCLVRYISAGNHNEFLI